MIDLNLPKNLFDWWLRFWLGTFDITAAEMRRWPEDLGLSAGDR